MPIPPRRVIHDIKVFFRTCRTVDTQELQTSRFIDSRTKWIRSSLQVYLGTCSHVQSYTLNITETLKYLYLIFDDDNFVHYAGGNFIFNTEGRTKLPPHSSSTTDLLDVSCADIFPIEWQRYVSGHGMKHPPPGPIKSHCACMPVYLSLPNHSSSLFQQTLKPQYPRLVFLRLWMPGHSTHRWVHKKAQFHQLFIRIRQCRSSK